MKQTTKVPKKSEAVKNEGEQLVRQLNRDVRDSLLVVSLLANAYVLIGWLVLEVSNRYDPVVINYLQK